MDKIEEYDKLKTKVLKYVLYKKRTEYEVRQKFQENTGNILESIIEYLKEENYINDVNYIQRTIKEFKSIKNMSIKEVKYKLLAKGLNASIIDEYIYNNKEDMLNYEINSAKNIIIKKQNSYGQQEIKEYLIKKGYMKESIDIVFDN